MDWYSWLSKTGLEPSLVYEYGVAFTHNELQTEDLIDFNHEFLQNNGISVAKHRLEILKLARKEVGGTPNGLSGLVDLVINKTKRFLAKHISKWPFHHDSAHMTKPNPYQTHRTGAIRKQNSVTECKQKTTGTNRSIMRSGPLIGPMDRRVQEKLMVTNSRLSMSGPQDAKIQERLMFTNRSTISSGPSYNRSPSKSGLLDERLLSPKFNLIANDHSPWSLMFQDMKPT